MERERKIVKKLRPIDDILFQKMAEDKDFCSELISTILDEKIQVIENLPQNSIRNLQGRSVILDAVCRTENGRNFNVEVQKQNNDNHQKRVRYNASCITANVTEPGSRFENVPDVCVIYISEFDIFQKGMSVYHIDRRLRETGEVLDNGFSEIYVYAKATDGTEVSELMKLFIDADAYDYQRFPCTSSRKNQFKNSEEGERRMCKELQEYLEEGKREAVEKNIRETARETARELFRNNIAYQIIKKCASALTDEELREIEKEVKG